MHSQLPTSAQGKLSQHYTNSLARTYWDASQGHGDALHMLYKQIKASYACHPSPQLLPSWNRKLRNYSPTNSVWPDVASLCVATGDLGLTVSRDVGCEVCVQGTQRGGSVLAWYPQDSEPGHSAQLCNTHKTNNKTNNNNKRTTCLGVL